MVYEKEMYHFLILHFPIALFFTGFIFDVAGYVKSDEQLKKFSDWNITMGVFWGALTIITGFITDQSIGHMDSPLPIWTTHGTHMIVAILLFLLIIIIKKLNNKEKIKISENYILLFHSLVLMFFMHGAHIGAKLADRL
tara:strand:+ start:43 stop:459 length:417 start_codon:yes stop_codon:yes gene_type:complete